MWVRWFPFGYYSALLSIPTLPTKIREKTWDLDKLFLAMKETKSDLEKLKKISKPSTSDLEKLKGSIFKLASEIQRGIKDLKYISFYDSTMFYLYYRLLQHVFKLCKNEEAELMKKEKALISDTKKDKNLDKIKNTEKCIEKQLKAYDKLIKNLKLGEKQLIIDYKKLVKELESLRWDAEKQAQHEFSLLKLTLRGMKNLNRKIKIEVIKVKANIVPHEMFLLRRIQRKGSEAINPQDVVQLAKLVSQTIDRISKDVIYSFKLVSKFEGEMKKLKKEVENLKKKLNKSIKSEETKNLIKPFDNAINYIEKQIDKDLMDIFRNIFVEYKLIETRPLQKVA